MTPEQLRAEIANDDATLQEVQDITARYRESPNPFLRAMANRCNPHAPCPTPDSCNADQICIYRCQWFADTPENRRQLQAMPSGETGCKPTSEVYQRHTVEITGPAPQYVEDELLAFERGYRRARYAWLFLGVLVVAYVAIRVWAGGGR